MIPLSRIDVRVIEFIEHSIVCSLIPGVQVIYAFGRGYPFGSYLQEATGPKSISGNQETTPERIYLCIGNCRIATPDQESDDRLEPAAFQLQITGWHGSVYGNGLSLTIQGKDQKYIFCSAVFLCE